MASSVLGWEQRHVFSIDLSSLRALPTWCKASAVVLFITACTLVVPRGGVPAVAGVALSAAAVILLAVRVTSPQELGWLIPVAILAILARDALVGALDVALLVTSGSAVYAPDE